MKKKTPFIFIASLAAILIAIVLASKKELADYRPKYVAEESQHIRYDDIASVHQLHLPAGQNTVNNATILWAFIFTETEEIHIEYTPNSAYQNNPAVDLDKISWQKDGDTLYLQLNDAVHLNSYQNITLNVSLPRRDWRIEGLSDYYHARAEILNLGEAINLELDIEDVLFSGNFDHLSVWRGKDYCAWCVMIDNNSRFDTLDIYYDGTDSDTLQIGENNVTFNRLNLHMDNSNDIHIEELSWLEKIHWYTLSETEKATLARLNREIN